MPTPIARPMTVPPPYPDDLGEVEGPGKKSRDFNPSPALLSDFKIILKQNSEIFTKYHTTGVTLMSDQESFITKFSYDETGDDLLSDDGGWSLAHNIFCGQIKSIISVIKDIEKTKGQNYIFQFTKLTQILNLSPEILAFVLKEIFGLNVKNDTHFKDIDYLENETVNNAPELYLQFLTQQSKDTNFGNLLLSMIAVIIQFYEELGFKLQNYSSLDELIMSNKSFNNEEFRKEISPLALRRFLWQNKKKDAIEISDDTDQERDHNSQSEDKCWSEFYRLLLGEIIKEIKITINETSLGKRNLSSSLSQKITDQLFLKFSRDLKAEQDNVRIEELGKQLKDMVSVNQNIKG